MFVLCVCLYIENVRIAIRVRMFDKWIVSVVSLRRDEMPPYRQNRHRKKQYRLSEIDYCNYGLSRSKLIEITPVLSFEI